MHKIIIHCCCLLILTKFSVNAESTTTKIATKNFQIEFLDEITIAMKRTAYNYLNEFLNELKASHKYDEYLNEIESTTQGEKLAPKIVLIKQLLDAKHLATIEEDLEHTYIMRNLKFLEKLRLQLKELREASALEIRQLRIYRLCKQFRPKDSNADDSPVQNQIATITAENIGVALKKLNASDEHTVRLNITQFGSDLYANVKATGAEIINNYLHILRQLLQEVMDEKPEHMENSQKIARVLHEIDTMIAIDDFYEKRQRLYGYLESNLAQDYEQFRKTENSQQDLAEIFTRLKSKGLDLFMIFIFSNFEFLEHVHDEWSKLLPQVPHTLYDEQSRVLHDIQHHYLEFKKDSENVMKYDTYVDKLKILHAKHTTIASENAEPTGSDGVNGGGSGHIFELLKNASENVGSVTLNMIKAKCDEL